MLSLPVLSALIHLSFVYESKTGYDGNVYLRGLAHGTASPPCMPAIRLYVVL